jgi:hypothetical protein
MSLKSFLKMQEGGQTFVSPFAQPDPTGTTKALTPRQMPGQTFELVTGIDRRETSPTITIERPGFGMPGLITPIREKKPENFDPGVSNVSSSGYTAQSPEVTAAAAALGIQVTGFENGSFYDTLVAMNQPETPFSKGLDNVLGPALPVTPKGTLGAAWGLFAPARNIVAGMEIAQTVGRTLSGEPIFGTSKADTPATTSKAATVTTAPVGPSGSAVRGAIEAAGARQGSIAAGEAMLGSAPAAPAATPVSVGQDIFGVAYGKGGEISPGFAIGGKGSFTSFAHYGAGVSQADESTIISTGMNNQVFADAQSGKDTVDALVANGYNEAQITAATKSTENLQDLDFINYQGADGAGGDGGTAVICTQLFSMGIMSANLYQGEGEHAKNIPNVIRRGYHFWAVPFVRGMRKNQLLFKLGKTLGLSWAQYAAHKANPDKFAPNYLGTFINAIGIPICAALGLFVGETDCETLWIDYEKGNGLCLDQQN